MRTLSIMKADTGGFVGHTAVHLRMVELARGRIEAVRGDPKLHKGFGSRCST